MPWAADHKRATRARIVRAAGGLFRRHGYAGVRIDAIMAAAGLTRGGFYAHFRSKADLLVAVTREEDAGFVRLLRAAAAGDDPSAAARHVVEDYLEPAHAPTVGGGCTLAALVSDIARADRRARQGYTRIVEALVEELERHVPPGATDGHERALVAATLCVGGVALARALVDHRLGAALQRACQARALRELGQALPARSRGRRPSHRRRS